jgi:hypothetical protein
MQNHPDRGLLLTAEAPRAIESRGSAARCYQKRAWERRCGTFVQNDCTAVTAH